MFRLDGKVALVMGGGRRYRGLGRHTATAFLLAGAKKVIITARKAEGPQGVKGRAIGIPDNVSNEAEILRLLRKIEQEDGRLDILNAPNQASEKILNLNVRGVFLLAQKFIPLLEKSASQQDPSLIIIVGSVAGRTVPHTGENGTLMYAVSKAAATNLELATSQPMSSHQDFFPSKLASGLIDILGGTKELEEANPRKRLGEPDDIAGVMIYLCSPAASYINGVEISVDGGMKYKIGRSSKM
ncbi:hypothetical protein BKA65DRAFT_528722 [Rhexocercosporidium sp. MPI-PUGE-AT-0058]|nr:hypothetical protein BKA65DRAFT_528722 [Rhexocercosporidium sp. MPI-PUGE-AT-0058]